MYVGATQQAAASTCSGGRTQLGMVSLVSLQLFCPRACRLLTMRLPVHYTVCLPAAQPAAVSFVQQYSRAVTSPYLPCLLWHTGPKHASPNVSSNQPSSHKTLLPYKLLQLRRWQQGLVLLSRAGHGAACT